MKRTINLSGMPANGLCCLLICAFIAPAAYALQVQVSIEASSGFQPHIAGTTNLPDGMRLTVRIDRKESAFEFQTVTQVEAGRFSVGPLTQRGADLNPGIYSVQVSCEDSPDQPAAAMELLGRRWEKLEGPLVRKRPGSVGVRYSTTFELGQSANPELDKVAREQAALSKTRWWRQNCANLCSGAEYYFQQRSEAFDHAKCIKSCLSNPPNITR